MCYIGLTRCECRIRTSSRGATIVGAVRGLLQGCAGKDQPLRNPHARSTQPFPKNKFSNRTRLMNMISKGPLLRISKESRFLNRQEGMSVLPENPGG
jgi:hypothetical protein